MSLARKLGALFASNGLINPVHGGAPAGVVLPFAGSTAPDGWLLCAGQAVSRSTYSVLFAVIGTAYGVGDGSTTFNLPDLRGRIPGGKDNMGGTAAGRLTSAVSGVDGATLGAAGGSQAHTLTTAQMPSHSHSGSAASAGAHTHTATGASNSASQTSSDYGPTPLGQSTSVTTSSAGAHTHTLTIDSQGGGQAHNNVQPTLVLNYIIKA